MKHYYIETMKQKQQIQMTLSIEDAELLFETLREAWTNAESGSTTSTQLLKMQIQVHEKLTTNAIQHTTNETEKNKNQSQRPGC